MTTYGPVDYFVEHAPTGCGLPGVQDRETNVREWYSGAVVQSLVRATGLICIDRSPDVNQTDMWVETIGAWEGKVRSIRLQLKSSSRVTVVTKDGIECVTHSLDRDYYDSLQLDATMPIFLVIVALPDIAEVWTSADAEKVVLNACAWWGEVTEPSNGLGSQTVHIPVSQRLDLSGLQEMLRKA